MNKIVIDNDIVTLFETDNCIELILSDKLDIFDVLKINLTVLSSTNIEIIYKKNSSTKLDFYLNIAENIKVNIDEMNESKELKIRYQYNIGENSQVINNQFHHIKDVKQLEIINLNGLNSSFESTIKTICSGNQKYDIYVYHSFKNTNSKIINKGVTVKDGNLTFNVTSIVYEGIKGCELDQKNRIVNLTQNKCYIHPILLIEEQDVTANHAAYIGTFEEKDLFYLKSRGLTEEEATRLMINGFLNDKKDPKIEKIINQYWR